jgi:hypothetical protein
MRASLLKDKLHSRAVQLVDEDLDKVRSHRVDYAKDSGLFIDLLEAPLSPMCEITHTIPACRSLINPSINQK